jgi:hypothetical protein
VYEELNVTAVRQRIGLSVLGDTEPGDVFYLVNQPAAVFWRAAAIADGYEFRGFTDDTWRRVEDIGTADPRQRVVILYNTRKFAAVPETDSTNGC